MKFRDLGKWVGLTGTTLRRRAKLLGHNYNLEDLLDEVQANQLYRQLPVEKVLTISYQDARKPKVEFVGPWNVRDWHRLFKKTQQQIMQRHRDFIRAARKSVPAQIKDQPVSVPTSALVEPPVDIVLDVIEPEQESVSSISALVATDAQYKGITVEENSYARRTESSHTGPPAISGSSAPAEPGGTEPAEREPCASGSPGTNAGGDPDSG